MAKISPALIERITRALRFQYDQILHEPVPDRWLKILEYLDDKEKRRRPARHEEEHGPPRQPTERKGP
jgi:hypothetical protein